MNLEELKQDRHDALLVAMADVLLHLSELLGEHDRKAYELNRKLSLARDQFYSTSRELIEKRPRK